MEDENYFTKFLLDNGVPEEKLPNYIRVNKKDLVPILDGYKKENCSKFFYVFVCNSGHDVECQSYSWISSGWNVRVIGDKVILLKEDWTFDISQIPIFNNTIFVVSARTKKNECAYERSDFVCFSANRQKLIRKFCYN
jgi:hypothetical protein